MSFSVAFIGTPSNVTKALREHAGKLTGNSLAEFNDALPHLEALVGQNVGGSTIHLECSGHANFNQASGEGRVKTYGNLSCHIRSVNGQVV